MNCHNYIKYLDEIPFGKEIDKSIYIHFDTLNSCSEGFSSYIKKIRERAHVTFSYNVIKLNKSGLKISFLAYPKFYELPHPILISSITIKLEKWEIKKYNYSNYKNPPILHRKELLLEPNNSIINKFKKLTLAEEAEGLYENPKIIGFKENWESILSEKGLTYKGHTLVRKNILEKAKNKIKTDIKRHNTAIKRYNFSKPLQTIQEHGLLNENTNILDFGCGKGDDVKALKKLGYNATGWDPVYKPDEYKIQSDIVNLGFVLNVIEDKAERSGALKEAFNLSTKLLVVSAMVANSHTDKLGKPYKDGILTKKQTFQKYFKQNELRDYIESTLSTETIAVGPGIFYVFKDPVEQQEFLSNRNRGYINWVELSRNIYPDRPVRFRKKDLLYEKNKDLVDRFWGKMIELGRIPRQEEFKETKDLRYSFGTPNSAKKLFVEKFGEETLSQAFELRKNDILVYLALSNFKKKVSFYNLSIQLRNDIKTFLCSYKSGLQKSRKLLFSISNPDVITELCNKTEFGYFDHKALYIHRELIKDLHPILRIYIGCAGILYGEIRNADIIKIHKKSGKVTLLIYDDFEKKNLPELIERVKVNLRKQWIDFFDHHSKTNQQLLYFKELYVAKDHPSVEKWKKFSNKLRKLEINNNTPFGPSKQEFLKIIEQKGLTLNLNKKRKTSFKRN